MDYLCGKLDFENFIHVSQKDIAAHLGVQRPRITEAINKLVERGIIAKGPSVGLANSYRLNPTHGWKDDNKKAYEY